SAAESSSPGMKRRTARRKKARSRSCRASQALREARSRRPRARDMGRQETARTGGREGVAGADSQRYNCITSMILRRWLQRTWEALARAPAGRLRGPNRLPAYARAGRYVAGSVTLEPRLRLLVQQLAAE